ncbi:MAG: hypothetical protein ACE5FO_08850 [Parvularculaceae bacterium]
MYFLAPLFITAFFATSSAPFGAQDRSPVEVAYDFERARLQASLEAAIEQRGLNSINDGVSMTRAVDDTAVQAGERQSMRSDEGFSIRRNGAIHQISSGKKGERLDVDLARFAPAYGGYCTETIAAGTLDTDDSVIWTLHGNRLYLARSPSTRKAFRENLAFTAESAKRYWENANAHVDSYGFGSSPKLVQPVQSAYQHC